MDNYRKAMDHNHFVSFMDDETIIANLGKYVEENSQKKNLIFLIDCEAFSSDYFQGVSDPNIDGLSKEQAYNLASFLASLDSLKAVLISNYNPTVEKFRSSKFLSSFVYKFVKTLNSKAQ
jgi:arginase family enzyme